MNSASRKRKKKSRTGTELKKQTTDTAIAEAFDITSSSSGSSFEEVGPRNNSFEKVNSWLDRGHSESAQKIGDTGTDTQAKSKRYSQSSIDYPPLSNKVQALLCFGEYSLFKKWVVLVEGDFIQYKSADLKCKEKKKKQNSNRNKHSLRDIRTLALTKNWLIICQMNRNYQVERDGVIPAGIALQIRRLVPLKFLRICISRPAQKVVAIHNQNGLIKEYQLTERPTPENNDQFVKWRRAISAIQPNHDEETLLRTLQMFERWTRQHFCRITVYPGNRSLSKTSLPDWQVTGPPSDPIEPAQEAPKEAAPKEAAPKEAAPKEKAPPVKDPSPPPSPPPKSESSESGSEISDPITGCEISVGGNSPMTLSNKSDVVGGIETAIGPSRPMTPEDDRGPPRPSRGPTTSDGDKKGKRSVRDVFKMGFFMSKKTKRKSLTPSPATGGNESDTTVTTVTTTDLAPRPRYCQRRVSRLEMNIPIEEVFSGIKFATIDHHHHSSVTDEETVDDSDVIEDPDEFILRLQRQCSTTDGRKDLEDGRDYLNYEGVFQDSHNNHIFAEANTHSGSVDFT